MHYIELDDCLYNLMIAENALNNMVDLNPYEEFVYEKAMPVDTTKAGKNKNIKGSNVPVANNNESLMTKAVEGIKNAIKAIKDMIANIISSISETFKRVRMSDEENNAFKEFKLVCAKDPSLKNKKITVADFRSVKGEYDKMVQETEQQIREVERNPDLNPEPFISKVNSWLGKRIKPVVTTAGADLALNVAKGNKDIANALNKSLKMQDVYLGGVLTDHLNETIGKDNQKRFRRKMKGLGKTVSLQRLKTKILKNESDCLMDALLMTADDMTRIIKPNAPDLDIGQTKTKTYTRGKKKGTTKEVLDIKATAKNAKNSLLKFGRENDNGLFLRSSVLGNEESRKKIKGVVKPVAKTVGKVGISVGKNSVKGAVKGKVSAIRDNRRVAKGKAPKGLNKSKVDSIAGYILGK